MQIHELNTFGGGTPGEMDFLALDTGFDTTKISAPDLLKPVREQADDLGAKKVDLPLDEHNDPSYGTAGQLLRTKGNGSTEWVDEGLPTDEQTEAAINKWLDDHPEATTTVADGSLTEAKFSAALKLKTLKDYVTPEMFGAIGDGLTDDTAAWNAAIASGKPIIAVNDYLTTSQLSLDNDVYMLGTIYNDVSSAVKISGKNRKTYYIKVAAKTQNSLQFVGVEILDTSKCHFIIDATNFYIGIKLRGYSTGCAYNYLESLYVENSKYFLLLQSENVGWCNENYFYNARVIGNTGSLYKGADYGVTLEKVSGTHTLNSNHFLNFCAEGSYCAVKVLDGRNNTFTNFRTEGCTHACDFAVGTNWNIFIGSYWGGDVLNNGNNKISSLIDETRYSIRNLIASSENLSFVTAHNDSSVTSPKIYNVWSANSIIPYCYNLQSNEAGIASKSGKQAKAGFIINVENNHLLRLSVQITGSFRICVVPFDANGDYISGATIRGENSTFSEIENGSVGKIYGTGANINGSQNVLLSLDSSIKSAFIGIYFTTYPTILHKLDIYGNISNFEEKQNVVPTLTTIPTSNGYYVGQEVYKTDGSVKWVWNGASWVEKNI